MPDRRTIRFFPDYGHEWPLWEDSTATHDYGYTMSPEDYDLSPELTARLRTWYDFWLDHDDMDEGWAEPENELAWLREGKTLAYDLRHEVADFADVSMEIGDVNTLRKRGRPLS